MFRLLDKLGYPRNGSPHPDGRIVVFLGDYIDRGPAIRTVLEHVRMLQRSHVAIPLMGNHEFNAICYHTEDDSSGKWLRPRNEKNRGQIYETLRQLGNDIDEWLNWMSSLSLWFSEDRCQAVHATWCPASQQALGHRNWISDDRLPWMAEQNSPVKKLLSGHEIDLPPGVSYYDKDDNMRTTMRTAWWRNGVGSRYAHGCFTPHDVALDDDTELTIPESDAHAFPGEPDRPTFVGHYWLKPTVPEPLTKKLACLDYSVARDGFIAAYRFDGEAELSKDKFVTSQ